MIATVSALMVASVDRREAGCRYSRLPRWPLVSRQSLGRRRRREDRCEVGQGREAFVNQVGLIRIFVRRRVAMLDVGFFLGVVEAPTQRNAHQPVVLLTGTMHHERREKDDV